ncbi:MAG: substrate-binding domain-containing protein [Eubacterium sp.]|nr:substrate-binding domain-containing protein [Eubacterium sp.]
MKRKVAKLLVCVMAIASFAAGAVAVSAEEAKEEVVYEPSTYTYEATELSSGKTYGVSVMTMANAFFKKEADTVKELVEKAGGTVLTPDPANDINQQVADITEFCARGVDCIIIDPIDSEGIKPALLEAQRAGIPVFIIDMEVTDGDLVESFIESDNLLLGREAAKTLCEAMGGKGEIGVINFSTIKCVRQRVQGLQEVIDESYPDIKIVADVDAFGVVEDAQSIMETFIQSYPNMNGVFAINSPTAQGAVAAIEAAGKAGEISVVDIDGAQNDIDMIKAGQILSSPVQFPAALAAKSVEFAEKYFAGKADEIDKHVMIKGENITIDNAAQYDGKTY